MLSLDTPSSLQTLPRSRSSTSMVGMRNANPGLRHKHIFIITGPAGCGKTTIAKYLSKIYNLQYLEGDDYHPQSNVEKMASGTPLTDADRWDWLVSIREAAVSSLTSRNPSSSTSSSSSSLSSLSSSASSSSSFSARTRSPGVVLTCSALKRKYRDVIRVACYNDQAVQVHFIYLDASEELLTQRLTARRGHFMPPSMIRSQMAALEVPSAQERDVVSVDVSGSLEAVQRSAVDAVMGMLVCDLEGRSA